MYFYAYQRELIKLWCSVMFPCWSIGIKNDYSNVVEVDFTIRRKK